MGVDTKAIIRKGVKIEDIEKAMSSKYKNVRVEKTLMQQYFYILFEDGEDKRNMAISYNGSCKEDNGIDGIWCSLGMWGNSVETMRYLCETFGGYIDENDCDDKGFYPINFHLYEQGEEFTPLDVFTNKIISELGYENLEKTLKLFNEFKTLA